MTNRIQLAVLFTGPYLTQQPGGIQTHAQNFLSAFEHHGEISLTYFPITRGLYNEESWAKKVYRFLASVWPFLQACKAVDVVHINSTFDNRSLVRDCVYLCAAALISRRRVLVQFHGGMPSKVAITRNSISRKLVHFSLSRASKILFLSQKQGASFSSIFPKLSYELVPNFIDCADVPLRAARQVTKEQPFCFVFIGRIDEKKGIREIVSATKQLVCAGKRFEVRLMGDGPLKAWLLDELKEHAILIDALRYEGPAYGLKKEEALATADAVLLPSYTEGFPYSLLEAAKYGLPLVSTPVGAIDEVIREGENGLLVSIGDPADLATKMQYLIDNPDVAASMGGRAREMALSRFSFRNLTQSFSGMYAETTGSK